MPKISSAQDFNISHRLWDDYRHCKRCHTKLYAVHDPNLICQGCYVNLSYMAWQIEQAEKKKIKIPQEVYEHLFHPYFTKEPKEYQITQWLKEEPTSSQEEKDLTMEEDSQEDPCTDQDQ